MKIALSVSEREKAKGGESAYFKSLVAAGAMPEELELLAVSDARRARPEAYDGILFAGGEDVNPAFYGEEKKYDNVQINRARDEFELSLLDRALKRCLPILGICRGLQMINVKFGGTLYQDLASDATPEVDHRQPRNRTEAIHDVTVSDSDSRLASALGSSCRVNSVHHQAIKRLGRGLKVTARSEDGFVEAVEAVDDYPFLLAVQWHPEEIDSQPEQRKIFGEFVAKCREAAAQQRGGASAP